MMSLIAVLFAPSEYNQGLAKPIAGLPARKRASLSKAMMDATTGDAAEVPPFPVAEPSMTVR